MMKPPNVAGSEQTSQWIFLADCNVTSDEDWLLAVKLVAGPCALDYLDSSVSVGKALSLRDLRLTGSDTSNKLYQVNLLDYLLYTISTLS